MMRKLYLWIIAGLVALSSCQQKPYTVYFLNEAAGGSDGSTTKFILMYNGHPYERMPIVTHEKIASYHSFMNMQDGSYGVVFTLKREWQRTLQSHTTNRQGMLILPVVNGLAFQPVRIEAPITDGRLVIWSGLNGYDLKQLARNIKPENPEMEKKRFKSKNPRPLPKLRTDIKSQQKDFTGRVFGEIYNSAN